MSGVSGVSEVYARYLDVPYSDLDLQSRRGRKGIRLCVLSAVQLGRKLDADELM